MPTKTLHGKVHGRTILLDEDPGVADGQQVEIQITVDSAPPPPSGPMAEGLTKVYDILGRRHHSGYADTAERRNDHQP
jgi:hypothetical protein